MGYAVAGVGDVNGDGFDDVLVGAPGWGGSATAARGMVTVHLGGLNGLQVVDDYTEADLAHAGPPLGDYQQGVAVSAAGDLNSDGFADFVTVRKTGVLVVFGGVPVWSDFETINLSFPLYPVDPSVSGGGDVDGDGYDDLLLGHGLEDGERGVALVFRGGPDGLIQPPAWTIEGTAPGSRLGWSVAMLGDVNGDGWSDFAVGEPELAVTGGEGVVRIFHGSPAGPEISRVLLPPNLEATRFGREVAAIGDVNGDGYADLAVRDQNPGQVFIYHGSSTGIGETAAWTSGSNRARSLAGAGDVNGDGHDDFLLGAPLSFPSHVNLFFGSPDGLGPAPVWRVEEDDFTWFGWDVAGAGDVNGDGFADFLYSEAQFDAGGQGDDDSTGRVFAHYGAPGACPGGDLADLDEDSVPCGSDNCPDRPNPLQEDLDGDLAGAPCDCDDLDPSRSFVAVEACDGVDSDCNPANDALEVDDDGDGFVECENWVGGAGVGGGGDCDDAEPTVYVDAPEINDGRDNQCPGDRGFGTADEISELIAPYAGRFVWTPQSGATSYEVVSSTDVSFSTGCILSTTGETFLDDSTALQPLETRFYLVRPAAPFAGSWGLTSTGSARTVGCSP